MPQLLPVGDVAGPAREAADGHLQLLGVGDVDLGRDIDPRRQRGPAVGVEAAVVGVAGRRPVVGGEGARSRSQTVDGILPAAVLAGRQSEAGAVAEMGGGHGRELLVVLGASAGGGHVDGVEDGIEGDDVDHAGNGVEAEEGGVRPLDHLDLADFLQLHRQRRPGGVAVVIDVDLAAVEQHQHPRAVGGVVAADGHVGVGGAVAPHIDPGHRTQNVGNIVGPGLADLVGGDDLHVDGSVGHPLGRAGGRGGDRFAEHLL